MPDDAGTLRLVAKAQPKRLEFDVSIDRERTVRSGRGGSLLTVDKAWSAEHLTLAALLRCTVTSLDHHLQKAGLEATARGEARGTVTRRDDDGLYAFVDVEARFEVELEGDPGSDAVVDLVDRAQRGCFVGNSLTARPVYHWTVNGEEIR